MQAMLICLMCPVINECTEYKQATNSEYGTWGGKPSVKGVDHA